MHKNKIIGLSITMINLNQDSLCPDRDTNYDFPTTIKKAFRLHQRRFLVGVIAMRWDYVSVELGL
jgi:hypothetical protein